MLIKKFRMKNILLGSGVVIALMGCGATDNLTSEMSELSLELQGEFSETKQKSVNEMLQYSQLSRQADNIEGIAEIYESASVSDSKFTITVGTLLEDFYYDEEEIFSESSVNNLVGAVDVGGRRHDVFFHAYTDISIYTTDYNLIINDMSGINIYIKSIILWTPRFCTSKGITVGATVDELKDVYGSENLELLDEDVPERTRYEYVDGIVTTDFYIEQGLITEIRLSY